MLLLLREIVLVYSVGSSMILEKILHVSTQTESHPNLTSYERSISISAHKYAFPNVILVQYQIQPSTLLQTKIITGEIVPTLITTSSVAAGNSSNRVATTFQRSF